MTMTIVNPAGETRLARALLSLWVGVFANALLFLAGDRVLNDPDTQ